MSDDANKRGGTAVGYCSPPTEHQFAKGKSGNPRGRPAKRERSILPRQHRNDILTAAERQLRIKTRDGFKTVTSVEAILIAAVNKAVSGHGPMIKYLLKYFADARSEHYHEHESWLSFVEMLEREEVAGGSRTSNRSYLDYLNEHRRQTRNL